MASDQAQICLGYSGGRSGFQQSVGGPLTADGQGSPASEETVPEYVLWMSQDSREAFGPAPGVTDSGWYRANSDPCLTRLRETGEGVIAALEQAQSWSHVHDLLRLQSSLFERYVRLQTAERTLSRAVARRRRNFSPLRQVELERQRLGRELHTDVGQLLTSIHLQAELIAALYPDSNPGLHTALNTIVDLSDAAIERVRSISKRLHPPAWLALTLESAIQQLWDLSGVAQRFDARLSIEALTRQPGLDAKVLLYRAAQEALSNVIRHSGATRVRASLTTRGSNAVLCFDDNGIGFDSQLLSAAPDLASGIGLRAIREQAEALGGTLRLQNGTGGAQFEVTVPLEQEQG